MKDEEIKSEVENQPTDITLEELENIVEPKTLLEANMIQVAALNKMLPKGFKFDTVENVCKQ